MPKLGMAPIRRKQLVEAAIAAIHAHGFANATVARIARQAGISAGMVHHYFKDKDEIFEAVVDELAPSITARRHRVAIDIAPDAAQVRAELAQLEGRPGALEAGRMLALLEEVVRALSGGA